MNNPANGLYFIAGGTGGIGSEVARRLRVEGSEVVLAARNEARLQERAREIGARAVPMDATRPEAVTGAFDAALREGLPLLGVVNCLGTILLKPAHLTSSSSRQTKWRAKRPWLCIRSVVWASRATLRRPFAGCCPPSKAGSRGRCSTWMAACPPCKRASRRSGWQTA
jgi:NAD(P)-dependent dehydrogenase (short-subunit alcohol dehydrogenase family)